MVNRNETFEQFMQRAVVKEWIREAVVGIAAAKFFNFHKPQSEIAIAQWEKTHGRLTGTK